MKSDAIEVKVPAGLLREVCLEVNGIVSDNDENLNKTVKIVESLSKLSSDIIVADVRNVTVQMDVSDASAYACISAFLYLGGDESVTLMAIGV